ncbi:VOC family protein [Flavobacterium sp. MAH-1]|uniref:VOC family protein n=1 Tax=Flavobacterium agri TaxID=2743471 RepID=A0A7Y9C6H3_9FLAO|nr:VOC family protein [Flavobacterium agri]NUY82066.1 VOC family protein [Flavobacterium agri]NYA72090.1 VOC family protein [Flavobacterium agri]
MAFKPTNYNSLSPYIMVDGAQQFSDLLKAVFDATELRKFEREDGSIMHLEIRIDDTVIMVSDATDDYPAETVMLHVYVPDVMATYQKALDNDCQALEAPTNKNGDPDKRGAFLDFAGNYWSVSTQM